MRAIISNGTNRFHLASLAASLAQDGALSGFITSGWPGKGQRRLAQVLRPHPRWGRFLDRAEAIDDSLVYSSLGTECLNQGARLLRARSRVLSDLLDRGAHSLYSARAAAVVRKIKPEIYHFRSCFGLSSVEVAKKQGALTICDHSIAHPRVLHHLVQTSGEMPPLGGVPPTSQIEQWMARDLAQADHVLVNSDFVKETCVVGGMSPERVHVIYWGLDDKFLKEIPPIDARPPTRRKSKAVLFAGTWDQRKGSWELLEAFGRLGRDHTLEIAGSVDRRWASNSRMGAFLKGGQVKLLGMLSRRELAAKMAEHSIFVFPTLCEGSARVVFEALACGCYVITTRNAGSIVEDGIHGRIVAPGRPDELAAAIEGAMASQPLVAEIGRRNANLVKTLYGQKNYSDHVLSLYRRLISRSASTSDPSGLI